MSVLEFFSELPTEKVAWSRTPGGVTLIRRARRNFTATVRRRPDSRLALRYFLQLGGPVEKRGKVPNSAHQITACRSSSAIAIPRHSHHRPSIAGECRV